MSKLLACAAIAEALTGLGLLIDPWLATRLLFSAEVSGVGVVVCRVGGFGLLGLGVACWPSGISGQTLLGIWMYLVPAGVYLTMVSRGGQWTGVLFWPAVTGHLGLGALLALAWFRGRKTQGNIATRATIVADRKQRNGH